MAAGKSGGSAGGVFLKGAFGSSSGESRGGGGIRDTGVLSGPDTQLCAPGGLGASGIGTVDGGQGTRCGRADFGSSRAKARAGWREAAR